MKEFIGFLIGLIICLYIWHYILLWLERRKKQRGGEMSIEKDTDKLLHGAKTGKTVNSIIYELLMGRRFDKIVKENEDIYEAWCLRIAETLEMRLEDEEII